MQIRIIFTIALSFIAYLGISQVSFHRLYETNMNDTIFYHMSSTTSQGEVIAMGTRRFEEDNQAIIFTRHDMKGNEKWSRIIELGRDTVDILDLGEIEVNGASDSILFTIDIEVNDEPRELFGRMAFDGSGIDLKQVGGNEFFTFTTHPDVAPFINETDLLLSSGDRPTISRLGADAELVWSRTYDFTSENGDSKTVDIRDIKSTADSTITIVGTIDSEARTIIAAELDSNGVQIWSEELSFLVEGSFLEYVRPHEIAALSDGTFAIVGEYALEFGSPVLGFIAQVDTMGEFASMYNYVLDPEFTTMHSVIEGADGTLWIGGAYGVGDSTQYFTTNFDREGSINWTSRYGGITGLDGNQPTDLLPVASTGGAVLVGNALLNNEQVLNVMKHDAAGLAMCSDTIPSSLSQMVTNSDTLISNAINGGLFFSEIEYEIESFGGFTPPTLSITQLAPFCPNEIIDTILVAMTGLDDDVVSYLWSTEETNDTIGIMEEGEYSVTVTVIEDVCYMMCDTVEVMRLSLPGVNINQDNSSFCDDGTVNLIASYMPGATGETYLWSTGEMTPIISVSAEGIYSVTVTDDCGEMASDDITMSLPVFDPMVGITNVGFNCETNTFQLTANPINTNPDGYLWSTGETSQVIFVEADGTYSVTVTECDKTASASTEVMASTLANEGTIDFELNCDDENPENNSVIFSGTTEQEGEIKLYVYNLDGAQVNGSADNFFNPTSALGLGTYNVELTDICDNVIVSDSFFLSDACGTFRYPKAFFPSGNDERELTFGPLYGEDFDINRVTEWDFKVFNRWGEQVFETTDITEFWPGTHKDDPAPTEVYIWYAQYKLDGLDMLDEGDVTLLR